ncbi:MAG: hypothetical protein AAF608_05215 [Pseudomonadota bacterium]
MNQQQRKYARERIEGLAKEALKGLEDRFHVQDPTDFDVEAFLLRLRKGRVVNHIREDVEVKTGREDRYAYRYESKYTPARPEHYSLQDIFKPEMFEGLQQEHEFDREGYEAEVARIEGLRQSTIDQIMLGDSQAALDAISSFETALSNA